MKLITVSIAIIFALLVHHHHPSLVVANHITTPNTSAIGFSFRFFNHERPDHSIHLDDDGFLHFQHSFVTNATTLHPNTFHPTVPHYEVLVTVGNGHGLRLIFLKIDASSSLTWIQCEHCAPKAKQAGPLFDQTLSPTFRSIGGTDHVCQRPYERAGDKCAFHIAGPGQLSVHGFLGLDLFYKHRTVPRNLLFGCSHSTENFESQGRFAGVFGMGRAPTSLVMQAAAQGLTQFSYCLFEGSVTKRHGLLSFGTNIPRNQNSRTTRILAARDGNESEYYLGLVGISLGARRLYKIHPEMFARNMDGQGGCVIDPGTPLTVMVEEVYHIVEEAIWSDLQHQGAELVNGQGFGLCVRATKAIMSHLPSLSLHFSEEEAVLVFSPKQLFLMMNERQGKIACLAVTPGQRTILGAVQQVDTRFIYDLKDFQLSFASESCIQDTVDAV